MGDQAVGGHHLALPYSSDTSDLCDSLREPSLQHLEVASSAPQGSTAPHFTTSANSPTEQTRPHTRLQAGVRKPKVYTDGIVRYGCLAALDEPRSLSNAPESKDWKNAMDVEFDALMKNKT
jgi:hypothetical protein